MRVQMTIGALGVAVGTASALGGVTWTQSAAPAPTYATTLNFDEPGTPTGLLPTVDGYSTDAFQAGYGILIGAGDSFPYVDNYSTQPGYSWLGTGNSFFANYGEILTFDNPVTEFSCQFWDPSGPPSFFGGGAVAYAFSPDDHNNPVAYLSFTPAWGGVGDTWLNMTTDGGTVIDYILVFGRGFTPFGYMDNLSWNATPTPGTAGLLGLAGIAGMRRRRRA